MILLLPILISSFLLTLPQRTTLFPYTTLFRSKKDAYRETGPPATSSSRCWRVARLRKSGGLRRSTVAGGRHSHDRIAHSNQPSRFDGAVQRHRPPEFADNASQDIEILLQRIRIVGRHDA